MNAWIRLFPIDPTAPESWHLQIGITQSGLRISACGDSYPPNYLVSVRPFAEIPSLEICEECEVAYRRMSATAAVTSL